MRDRPYYSHRGGKQDRRLNLDGMKGLLKALYSKFEEEGYFKEHFGHRGQFGWEPGRLEPDISNAILLRFKRPVPWPLSENIESYSENDLFDIIEFLFDHMSKPTEKLFDTRSRFIQPRFNQSAGRQDFRTAVNEYLCDYADGYELSVDGDILNAMDSGFEDLHKAPVPTPEKENIQARVESAKLKFRRHGSSIGDKGDAVTELAHVLEYLRPKLKMVLTQKDERDLFSIINNFGIRHHNEKQKTHYDKAIWLDWMFYYFLATIYAALRIIDNDVRKGSG